MFKEIGPVNKSFIAHHIQMNEYKMKLMSDSTPFILLCSQYNFVTR